MVARVGSGGVWCGPFGVRDTERRAVSPCWAWARGGCSPVHNRTHSTQHGHATRSTDTQHTARTRLAGGCRCREMLRNSPTALRVLKAALNAAEDGQVCGGQLGGGGGKGMQCATRGLLCCAPGRSRILAGHRLSLPPPCPSLNTCNLRRFHYNTHTHTYTHAHISDTRWPVLCPPPPHAHTRTRTHAHTHVRTGGHPGAGRQRHHAVLPQRGGQRGGRRGRVGCGIALWEGPIFRVLAQRTQLNSYPHDASLQADAPYTSLYQSLQTPPPLYCIGFGLVWYLQSHAHTHTHIPTPQGRQAYMEKRAPDFSKFKRLP